MARQPRTESRTVSVRYAAAALGVGSSTLYRRIEAGDFQLPVLRIGTRILIPRDALDRALRDGLAPARADRATSGP